jgi:hypothetical protein
MSIAYLAKASDAPISLLLKDLEAASGIFATRGSRESPRIALEWAVPPREFKLQIGQPVCVGICLEHDRTQACWTVAEVCDVEGGLVHVEVRGAGKQLDFVRGQRLSIPAEHIALICRPPAIQ